MDEAEIQINDWEHKEAKNNHAEQEEKKESKTNDSVSSLWDNFKHSNIRIIMGCQKEKRKSNKLEIYLK